MSTKNICDLVMLVPHLGDGGTQKVVTTLANEWNKKGKKITVITIYDHSDDYVLEPGVKRIKLNEVTEQYDILTMLSLKLETFSQKIKELKILYLLCLPIIYLSVLLINITRLIFFILRFSFILIIKFKEILVSFKVVMGRCFS